MAIIVDINPVMAAPIPAIWPIGSIAMALRFPNKKPRVKNCMAKKVINIHKLGFWEFQNKPT